MRGHRLPLRRLQQGFASIVAAMLLVAGVIFILMQSMGVMQTRSVDTARADDSAAAFMLAESGLENATATISNTASSGGVTDSTCTNLSATFTLGRGTFKHANAQSQPSPCVTDACTFCTVTSQGVVGSAERDLNLKVEYGTTYGVTGRGKVVTMVLKNIFSQDAIALFDLSWRRQGSGGNASSTLTGTCDTCTLMWNLNSSSGMHSAGGLGTAVSIPALTASKIVTQTLDYSRDYTEVGGLFPGLTSAPSKISAYWSDGSEGAGATYTTFSNNGSTAGVVRAGVATSSTASCASPSNPPGNNNDYQTCTSWCNNAGAAPMADTLIMGLAARSTSVSDATSAASFDTAGNNISLNKLVHYPDSSAANATGSEYSEIWYAYNPAYSSTSDPVNSSFSGAGATSYTAAVIGAAGATLNFPNSSKIGNNQTTGTFTSVTGYGACVGDTIVDANLTAGTTITAMKQHSTGTAVTCVTAGTVNIDITISPKANGNVTAPTVTSTSLHTTANTGNLAAGSATVLAGGSITVASGPDGSGVYTLSSPATVASGYIVQGSGSSTTITVSSSNDLPDSTKLTWLDGQNPPQTHNTIYRVYSTASGGTGALASNTTISSVNSASKTFTISALPTTPLVGATLCAGTCAFFNTPNNATAVTNFSITPSAGTSQWAIGFMCLKGVDPQHIIPVTSTGIKSRTWSEAVQ